MYLGEVKSPARVEYSDLSRNLSSRDDSGLGKERRVHDMLDHITRYLTFDIILVYLAWKIASNFGEYLYFTPYSRKINHRMAISS